MPQPTLDDHALSYMFRWQDTMGDKTDVLRDITDFSKHTHAETAAIIARITLGLPPHQQADFVTEVWRFAEKT